MYIPFHPLPNLPYSGRIPSFLIYVVNLTFAALEKDDISLVGELVGTWGSFSEQRMHSCVEQFLLWSCAQYTNSESSSK